MQGKEKKRETEEERLVRLEMEALAAEEENRRAVEAARVKLRQKQLNEERYARTNMMKIHSQWRKIMRQAKVDELRADIEVLSQNHEREVDRKDAITQMLDRDLEDSEEQYQMALRGHSQIVDSLMDLQYMRMKDLHENFLQNLKALEDEFESEFTEISNTNSRQRKEMSDMMDAMESEFAEAEAEAKHDFESQREEIKNKNSEDYNVLKISLESTIDELERHFDQAHVAYLSSTDARTESFKQLTRSDAQSARIIEKRMRRLMRLQDSLTHWRTKISSNSREWDTRNKALRAEKDIMAQHYHRLKASMDKFRQGEGQRLKALSLNSREAIDELKKKVEMAEKILHLAELCRKLETESEKVLPFASLSQLSGPQAEVEGEGQELTSESSMEKLGMSSPHGHQEREPVKPPTMSSYGVDSNGNVMEEWNYLNNFFKKHNKVLLDNLAIEKEHKRLSQENQELREILKQYLDGISVNEDVLNNPENPLLVVNSKLQHSLKARAAEIEAPASRINTAQPPASAPGQEQLEVVVQHVG